MENNRFEKKKLDKKEHKKFDIGAKALEIGTVAASALLVYLGGPKAAKIVKDFFKNQK